MRRALLCLTTLALAGGCASKTRRAESERKAHEQASRAESHVEGAAATAVNEARRSTGAVAAGAEAAASTAVNEAERAVRAAKSRFESTYAGAERNAVHERFAPKGLAPPGGRLVGVEPRTERPAAAETHAAPPLATTAARVPAPSGASTGGRERGLHVVATPSLTLSPVRGEENPSGYANAFPAAPALTVSPPRGRVPGEATIETGGPAIPATPRDDSVTTPRRTPGQ